MYKQRYTILYNFTSQCLINPGEKAALIWAARGLSRGHHRGIKPRPTEEE